MISQSRFEKARIDYARKWRLLDQTLYAMCKKYPGHETEAKIRAKLWIIGRTYATGIERKITASGSQGSSLSRLTKHFFKNRIKLKNIFENISGIKEPITEDMLRLIILAHGQLVSLIRPLLYNSTASRSFCSKYLHFHNPVIPIYDSLASAALRMLYHWKPSFQIFTLPKSIDEEYCRFLFRFWQFYLDVQTIFKRKPLTVKELDHYLIMDKQESSMHL